MTGGQYLGGVGKGTTPAHDIPIPPGYDTATVFDPFEIYVGPLFDQRKRGVLKFAFRVDERHVNAAGICHGGMLLTFADSAFGYTAWGGTEDAPSVTASMQANFLAPARLGSLVEVAPQITRKARDLIFIRGDFMVGGDLVMTAASLWKLLKR